MDNSNLGNRMKQYENVTRHYMTCRTPVIIRVDGKAFHSFTKGFDKPFDEILTETMIQTMYDMCCETEGCVMAYTQSDEITFVLRDDKNIDTQAWFQNNILKMCSISASMATRLFNRNFRKETENKGGNSVKYTRRLDSAMFDSRVFNIPLEEVPNCLIWRQLDAIRNSIQAAAQAQFSHRELEGVTCKKAVEKLMNEKNIDWNDYPVHLQRGTCCVKVPTKINVGTKDETIRMKWRIDRNIPVFTENREYITRRLDEYLLDGKELRQHRTKHA